MECPKCSKIDIEELLELIGEPIQRLYQCNDCMKVFIQ